MGIILAFGILVSGDQKIKPHIVDFGIIFFLVSLSLTNIVNVELMDGKQLNHSISWLVCFLLFFYVNRFCLKLLPIEEIYVVIVRCYLLVTVFAIVEFLSRLVLGIDLNGFIPRPGGQQYEATFLGLILQRSRAFFSESAHAGMYIALTYPFVKYWMKQNKSSALKEKIMLFITLFAAFTIFSTTFFIFFPAFIFLIFALGSKRFYKRLMILTPILFLAVFLFRNEIYLIVDAAVLSKFQTGSADIRAYNMAASVNLIKNSSLLHVAFGYGPGSYFKLSLPDAAPSVYINILRDMGVVGLFSYCSIWFLAIIAIIYYRRLEISKYLLLMVCMVLIYHVSNMEYNFVSMWFVLFSVTEMNYFSVKKVN